ncbi:MAG: methyltransferase [Candidatus ainarchaeum sp.]|nr:methyltransferase [Candidatus ainarchaeum sp.]
MPILNFKEYSLDMPEDVYLPSEDTDLMLAVIKTEISNQNILFNTAIEIGAGNGFLSLCVYDFVRTIYSVDINPIVVDYLLRTKKKYNLDKQIILQSDLFSKIDQNQKFDLIIFNPPYVPSEEISTEKQTSGIDLAVDGGRDGAEIINKFIDQLFFFLSDSGVCYLLISSLNKQKKIEELLKKNNLFFEIVGSKKLFFEELFVLKIKK